MLMQICCGKLVQLKLFGLVMIYYDCKVKIVILL